MTTTVKITHTNGPTREMDVSFGDEVTGYRRCIGAAHRDPFAEPEEQTTVRLLGAASIHALDSAIPAPERSERSRLANIARTKYEEAVMFAVKALYAPSA